MSKISIPGIALSISMIIMTPLNAEDINNARDEVPNISPRQLVSLARQGRFKSQGISSYDNFRQDVRAGRITAQDLIRGAIASSRLAENVINDPDYHRAVAGHLKSGGCGS